MTGVVAALSRRLFDLPKTLLVTGVRAYRLLLSPWLGSSCRFTPTCSAYALDALERHGAVLGTGLTAWRVLRCGPWCEGGHDPVAGGGVDVASTGLPLHTPDLRVVPRSGPHRQGRPFSPSTPDFHP